MFLAGSLLLVPIVLSTNSLAGVITKPLVEIARLSRIVSAGGSLEKKIRIITTSNDEVGLISADFNVLLALLENLRDAARTVAAGDLREGFEHSSELDTAFRGMLIRLRRLVGQLHQTSSELSETASELRDTTLEQERDGARQVQRMQELGVTISSLSEGAADVTTKASGVLSGAEQAATTTDEMSARISDLGDEVARITQLLELIRGVADRSDLLALNGSLEATRAGDAGRGFALVAVEMRRLAERTNETVLHVRERLDDIEQARAKTISATERSRSLARNAAAAAAQAISALTEQQSQDTRMVSRAVSELAASVVTSTAGLSQVHAVAEQLRVQAVGLQALTGEFTLDE